MLESMCNVYTDTVIK